MKNILVYDWTARALEELMEKNNLTSADIADMVEEWVDDLLVGEGITQDR